MLLLIYIPGEMEFTFFFTLSIFIVIPLLIIGLWQMFKNRVYDKEITVPLLFTLMLILFPTLILFVPNMMGRRGGYIFATVVLLWGLGIIIVNFIIIIYLVNSKKNLLLEIEPETLEIEKGRLQDDAGLKTGALIIIICVILFIILGIFGNIWLFIIDLFYMILRVLLSILILLGSIYGLYRKKYFTYGSIICVVGGISTAIFPFYIKNLWGSEFSFSFINDNITITLGILPIFGVILHHMGQKGGSILCIIMGVINFTVSFLMVYSGVGGGLLTIFPSIQLEPILMMVGGYFLYQKQVRT